jgi:hypothetical protein
MLWHVFSNGVCLTAEPLHDHMPFFYSETLDNLVCLCLQVMLQIENVKKGRPLQQLPPFFVNHWHHSNTIPLNNVGTADKRQFYFLCSCRLHVTFRSAAAVIKNPSTLVCRVCEPNNCKKPPSSHEIAAYAAMRTVWGEQFMTEVRYLGGRFGAIDILVRLTSGKDVAVMIDGKHHFSTDRQSRTAAEQGDADMAFNRAALAQGLHVVRLHYKDQWEFQYLLRTYLTRLNMVSSPTLQQSPSFHTV